MPHVDSVTTNTSLAAGTEHQILVAMTGKRDEQPAPTFLVSIPLALRSPNQSGTRLMSGSFQPHPACGRCWSIVDAVAPKHPDPPPQLSEHVTRHARSDLLPLPLRIEGEQSCQAADAPVRRRGCRPIRVAAGDEDPAARAIRRRA